MLARSAGECAPSVCYVALTLSLLSDGSYSCSSRPGASAGLEHADERNLYPDASQDDVTTVVSMIRLMVTDMADLGGHAPAAEDSAWDKLTAGIAEELNNPSVRYMLAQSSNGEIAGVAGARLVTLGGAFAPKKTLHISVMCVRPPFRRQGIAEALMAGMLDWGASAGAVECDLNVLVGKGSARAEPREGRVRAHRLGPAIRHATVRA